MKSKQISDKNGEKTYAVIFETGDEVNAGLLAFAEKEKLAAAHLTAIGAVRDVILGYYDIEKKEYKKIPLRGQFEVLSLVGDVALDESSKPKVHAHIVIGQSDGVARGGHLLEAHVRPTLEAIVVETPSHLQRRFDAASGLALIRI